MRNSSAEYGVIYTEQFARKLDGIRKADPNWVSRIESVAKKIRANPSNHDGPLKGQHAGRYKKYVGKRGYRIVYAVCHDCRSMGKAFDPTHRCEFCDQTPDMTVVFFHVGKKAGRASDYGS